MPIGENASSYQGAYRVPLFNYSVCVSISVCNICRFELFRELHEVDFRKPGIYESGTEWANECHMFPHMASRVRRGRRAAEAFLVGLGWGGLFSVFFPCVRIFKFVHPEQSASTW